MLSYPIKTPPKKKNVFSSFAAVFPPWRLCKGHRCWIHIFGLGPMSLVQRLVGGKRWFLEKKNMTLLSKQYVTRLFFKVESPLKFHLSLLKILNMEAFFSRVVLVQQWSFYFVLQFQALFQFTWNENMPSHILQCSKTPASNLFEIVWKNKFDQPKFKRIRPLLMQASRTYCKLTATWLEIPLSTTKHFQNSKCARVCDDSKIK